MKIPPCLNHSLSAGMKIGDLIPRLLMYGIYTGTKRDLSLGGIDGVWYEWVGDRKSWQKGETPIGTASSSQFNVHRTHQ